MQFFDGEAFARVTGTRVKMPGRLDLVVERVVIGEDLKGNPSNIVSFVNGPIWGNTKERGQPFVLVQVFDTITARETLRVLIWVER